MEKIKAGVVGYGNLGKAVVRKSKEFDDFEIKYIFTRRDPESLGIRKGRLYDDVFNIGKDLDLLILCGGSKTDIPVQGPELCAITNTVDAYDHHAELGRYRRKLTEIGNRHHNSSVIAAGWDPGLFSLMRLIFDTVFPEGQTATFWGKGVSQGHSDALRRIPGVRKAVQYTVPKERALRKAREGKGGNMTTESSHKRVCYITAKPEDRKRIEESVRSMEGYFKGYETEIFFISDDEFEKNHRKNNHGGHVIGADEDGAGIQRGEFTLELSSNPDFTARILLAAGRAAVRLNREGLYGARSLFEIPPAFFSAKSVDRLTDLFL